MFDGFLPLLSAWDPRLEAEGSIDPLGLYTVSEQIGSRLAPGVRERQTTVRFLTAIAVSHALAEEFPEDALAKDGVSEPWQVFEWFLVEGLVRTLEDETELRGIPGRAKAKRVVDEGLHLDRACYLKTPTVFGFHGVYRALAVALGIETAGQLGPNGARLLAAWRADQGLCGFAGEGRGAGREVFEQLRRAIADGLEAGEAARVPHWGGWAFFRGHLAPRHIGPREKQVLGELLHGERVGFRHELVTTLTSPEGQRAAWAAFAQGGRAWDTALHELLLEQHADNQPLTALVRAAQAYERLARLLTDAFEEALFTLSEQRGKTALAELAAGPFARRAAAETSAAYANALARLNEIELGRAFEQNLSWLAQPLPAPDFMRLLLEHHVNVQRRKPPRGKAPWVECFDDGRYMVRAQYRRVAAPEDAAGYVNAYRAGPLWRFAWDLGWVNGEAGEAIEEG